MSFVKISHERADSLTEGNGVCGSGGSVVFRYQFVLVIIAILSKWAYGARQLQMVSLIDDLQRQEGDEQELDIKRLISILSQQPSELTKKHILATLGAYFVATKPNLARQYLIMARTMKAPPPSHSGLDQTVGFYLAKEAFLRADYQAVKKNLIPILKGKIPASIGREAFETLLTSFFKLEEFENYRKYFALYKAKVPRKQRSDYTLRQAVEIYEAKGKYSEYFKLLESLADQFPTTENSKWAFGKLYWHSRAFEEKDGRKPYFFSVRFLAKMSRSRALQPGSREALLGVIETPVRFAGKTAVVKGLEKAKTLFRMREFGLALSVVEKFRMSSDISPSERNEALYLLGRIHGRLGNHDYAAKYWEQYFAVESSSVDRRGFESFAQNLSKTNQHDRALLKYRKLLNGKGLRKYRWLYFWETYLAGNLDSAMLLLSKKRFIRSQDRAEPMAPLYWQAQIYLKQGLNDRAYKIFEEIIAQDEFSYYSTLIRGHFSKWQLNHSTALVSETKSSHFVASRMKAEDAQLEMQWFTHEVSWRPDSEKIKYPLAFDEYVEPISQYLKLDKFLLLSIMRAESNFRINARSRVGARGLIQMMPYTAIRVARLMGDTGFSLDELNIPAVNIGYGAYYLNHLLRYYHGNYVLAIAAYNAGPNAVDEWIGSCGRCRPDEFIESIPYSETRRYVKKVIRFHAKYKYIYNKQWHPEPLPPIFPGQSESVVIF